MVAVSLPFLPFARPEIGDDEIAEVVDTLRSGWLTTGPKAKRFEDDFSAYLGDPTLQSLAVNSATAGRTSARICWATEVPSSTRAAIPKP